MREDEGQMELADKIRLISERKIWSQNHLAKEMRDLASPKERAQLPGLDSMARRIRAHQRGEPVGPVYAELYRRLFARHADLFTPTTVSMSEDHVDPLVLAWTVGRLNQRVDRRTLLQLAAVTAAGTSALEPAERLLRALTGQKRPDDETVEHLEGRTRGLHRLEEHWPARKLYPALLTHISEIGSLLETTRSDDLRHRLAVTAGESAVLAAWFAWELGDRQHAERQARLAGVAAKQTDDVATAACMSGYQTYMTGGNHSAAVTLATNALQRLGDADPATRAWLLGRKAEESALLGDHQTALEAIREAEDVYATADINARPWTCFVDPTRFASMTLSVYSRIAQEDRAMGASRQVAASVGPSTEIKKLCVVQADMALAHYRLGDVTEAVRYARSSLEATTAMAAPLGWDRLDQVVGELADSRVPAAGQFRTEYAATRPKTAPPSLL
ncbi:XRE family transcriptional regulator [Actinomadura fibrosa]|uniref:XRE family transcriptional regulator n=1 Tax=Actinomadura fibrosa TaxID=111802 RepID=A0ABW2XCZ0_9ACTN|nr:XRE family transcriptional regulator [Actinomadura fibrosa]